MQLRHLIDHADQLIDTAHRLDPHPAPTQIDPGRWDLALDLAAHTIERDTQIVDRGLSLEL